MGLSPPFDEINERNLLARLDQKRREIEAEIEAFKAVKEDEYRELERKLREEQKSQPKKKRKRENGGANSSSGGEEATDATHVAAGATSSDDGAGFTGKEHGVGSINSGAQIPLDLGGSRLNDTLRLELPEHRKQVGFDGSSVSSSTTTSPPFEKELQAAGLFTPRYLPLLDNNYFRQTSPPVSPPPQDPSISVQTQTSPQQTMPKLAAIPSPSSRTGNTSPAYPLASSLKSSSGSSTGTLSKSGAMKQKSPKRVTFQFEDEDSVPSRSSPPPTKVHWTLEEGYPFEDEDGYVEYEGEEIEEVDEDEFDERGKVEQVEHVTMEGLEVVVTERFPGDELVVPTAIGRGAGDGDPSTMQNNNAFSGLGISGVLGEPSMNGMNGNKGGDDPGDEQNRYDDDDDEEALFDLDETIPEVVDSSPPQRDYSALMDSPKTQTNARLIASSFPMLPSFTAGLASASESVLTFGKSPGPRPGLPRVRKSSLSSSLSPISNQTQFAQQEPIASSLPNFGWKGIDPPRSGFVPTTGGRFRRRSIVKYDIPEDDTASLKGKGKGKETQHAIPEASDEEDNDSLLLSRSPNATSLPMSISRLSPAAFAAVSNAIRSPKPLSKPVTNNDIPDPTPVSARPSPKPRSPLPCAESFPVKANVPKIDSADLLASMSTSFTVDDASPEKNDSVSSYRRSSPFPSAYDRTPYRTAYAAEVAAAAALDDEADYGGAMESVVGGVDGRTGLDPDVSSFSYRASSLGPGAGSRGRSGSTAGGGMEAVDPGRMSLGMRMAWESGMKDEGRRR